MILLDFFCNFFGQKRRFGESGKTDARRRPFSAPHHAIDNDRRLFYDNRRGRVCRGGVPALVPPKAARPGDFMNCGNTDSSALPRDIFSGNWDYGHCQGIAIDTARKYLYYSFTTALIKTDLGGNLIGSVTGLMGHLGCIDFCDSDGRVYGSLEYKNDVIGRGILNSLGSDAKFEEAFYMAVFDADKITRPGMDATRDGVMKTVYLKEVVDDYNAEAVNGGKTVKHRYGCSGIDGTAFGPMPGSKDKKEYLFVSYGVYGDVSRTDNDDQVILCYDTSDWDDYLRPLCQDDMHKSGPAAPFKKLFVHTGNTVFGVQNLEYDAFTNSYFMAVYRGQKPEYPNYPLFAADAGAAPNGNRLTLRKGGLFHESSGVYGWEFPYGSTGLIALGDGYYYVSHEGREDGHQNTHVRLYRWDGEHPFTLAE